MDILLCKGYIDDIPSKTENVTSHKKYVCARTHIHETALQLTS
jgi:hypothetical protein